MMGMGQKAERDWVQILVSRGYTVLPAFSYLRNNDATPAPMVSLAEGLAVSPDVLAMKPIRAPGGASQLWTEVKAKTKPGFMRCRNRWEHGCDYWNWQQYLRVQAETAVPCYIVVFELFSPGPKRVLQRKPTWLYAPVDTLLGAGRRMKRWPSASKPGRNGQGGWLWPRHVMDELKPQLEMFDL